MEKFQEVFSFSKLNEAGIFEGDALWRVIVLFKWNFKIEFAHGNATDTASKKSPWSQSTFAAAYLSLI